MTQPTPRIFHTADLRPPQRKALTERVMEHYPGQFASPEEAGDYLHHIFVPASLRWACSGNSKAGTTTVKRALFQLEFGVALTVEVQAEDLNDDHVPHLLPRAGVFRTLSNLPSALQVLGKALRLTMARHPTARAISSFLYICHSQTRAHSLLSDDRFRMNALVGFDWNNDPGTARGFEKFLTYLQLNGAPGSERLNDPHLRPQVQNVRPELFKPDLIGRTENLAPFFRQIADRLGQSWPADWQPPQSNRQTPPFDRASLLTPATLRLIETVFEQDFAWLGEDPQSCKP